MKELLNKIKDLQEQIDKIKSRPLNIPLDIYTDKIIKDTIAKAEDDTTSRITTLNLTGNPQNINVFQAPNGYIKLSVLSREVWIPFFNV